MSVLPVAANATAACALATAVLTHSQERVCFEIDI